MTKAKETPTASTVFNPWRAVRDAVDDSPARGDAPAVVAREAPAPVDEAVAGEKPPVSSPGPEGPPLVEAASVKAASAAATSLLATSTAAISPAETSPEVPSPAAPPPAEAASAAAAEGPTQATGPSVPAPQVGTPPPAAIAPVAVATGASSGTSAGGSFLGAMPDRGLFLLFAFGGFALVMFLKSRAQMPLHTAGAAVAVLLVYAIVGWRIAHYRRNPDRLGENCYYLGFLYTLASLSAALMEFQYAPGDRVAVIERIVSDFGVAIFSTIAGIAARVALMQIRRDADDADDELRNDFVAISARLRDSLRGSVDDAEAFRARMRDTLSREMEAVVRENADALRSIRAETGTLVAGIEELARRLSAAEVPQDLLVRQFDALQARVGAIADGFGRAAEADGQRNEAAAMLVRELASAQERIANTAPFEQAQASAEALAMAVERIGTQVRDLTPALASLQQAFEAHVGHGVAEAEALRRLRESMEDDLEAARRTLRALQGAMADVADGLVRRLGP
jgi:hypothetical protein